MLDSLEGKRGQVRAKPPLPAHKGLFGMPDGDQQRDLAGQRAGDPGRGRRALSRDRHGPLAWHHADPACRQHQVWRAVRGGFGLTLGELVNDIGGGTFTWPSGAGGTGGRTARRLFPAALFDTPFDYEAFAARDGLIGHGGVVVFDDTRRSGAPGALRHGVLRRGILRQMHAVPDRFGARHGGDRSNPGRRSVDANIALLRDLCETMKFGSLCALGGFIPYPVMSALEHFPEDFAVRRSRLREVGAKRPGEPRMTPRFLQARRRLRTMPLIHETDYGTPQAATVTLTIDGQDVTVPEGTSVMRAAMLAGIKVPKLCATNSLDGVRIVPSVPG